MNQNETKLPKPETDPIETERVRLAQLLFDAAPFLAAEYKSLIKHTGGLLTNSMVYAYSKGLQDAIKTILKENNKETNNVQEALSDTAST